MNLMQTRRTKTKLNFTFIRLLAATTASRSREKEREKIIQHFIAAAADVDGFFVIEKVANRDGEKNKLNHWQYVLGFYL